MIRLWRVLRWVWRLVTTLAMIGVALYALVSVLGPASARWVGFGPSPVEVERGAGARLRVLGYHVAPVVGGYNVTLYWRYQPSSWQLEGMPLDD